MRVAIIGAGITGLYSIKSCLEEDLKPVCYERYDYIGGMWNYRDDDKVDGARIYENLHLNALRTSQIISDFPDLEGEREDPPTAEQHLKYVLRYVKHFKLDDCINLNHEVVSVEPSENHDVDKKWVLKVKHEDVVSTEIFDAVMVCSGRYRTPIKPDIPGFDNYQGVICPPNQFKHNRQSEIVGKEVLIIGNAYTAGDMAVFMSSTAKKVYLSIGRGCSIVGLTYKDPNPIGIESFLNNRSNTYRSDVNEVFNDFLLKASSQHFPDQETYGIAPGGVPMSRPVMINNFIPRFVREGKVTIKHGIKEITKEEVIFEDGTTLRPDTIFSATGYEVSFPFLSKDIIPQKSSEMELYKFIFPLTTKHQNLVFVGATFNGFVLYVTFLELQARWAVQVLKGNVRLPSRDEMVADMKRRREVVVKMYGGDRGQSDKPAVAVCDFMAKQIGCLPNFWKLAFTDPYLAYIFWYGTAYSCHYRLVGPHRWPEARAMAIRLYQNWRRQKGDGWNWKTMGTLGAFSVLASAAVLAIWKTGQYLPKATA